MPPSVNGEHLVQDARPVHRRDGAEAAEHEGESADPEPEHAEGVDLKFIAIVCATFLARVRPVSTSANPACMNMTRKPVISVQTMFMAIFVSLTSLASVSVVTLSLSLVNPAVMLAPV